MIQRITWKCLSDRAKPDYCWLLTCQLKSHGMIVEKVINLLREEAIVILCYSQWYNGKM